MVVGKLGVVGMELTGLWERNVMFHQSPMGRHIGGGCTGQADTFSHISAKCGWILAQYGLFCSWCFNEYKKLHIRILEYHPIAPYIRIFEFYSYSLGALLTTPAAVAMTVSKDL